MTHTLVIDSATENCSVALFDDGGTVIAGDCRLLGRGHAEHLLPMIAALPNRGKAGRIAVSLGPGSFTGVRIGVAAARALGLAWNATVVGYPTLALVAAMARTEFPSEPVTVAMTGGHGEWFIEHFSADGQSEAHLHSLPPDAALAEAYSLVAGTQAAALVAARSSGTALPLLPDARAFKLMAHGCLSPSLTPLYGRPPDARLPEKVQ